MPRWLDDVRKRSARFAGFHPEVLVQALLIRYDPGAGNGWHMDRPVFEHFVGISLGQEATLRLHRWNARGFERAKAELMGRSIYQLSGEARHHWEHSIAPIKQPRWSITFRSFSARNRMG